MAASNALIKPPDDAYLPDEMSPRVGDAERTHHVLRLPGGEPGPRLAPARAVSVRRTVGIRERRTAAPTSGGDRLVRAGVWGAAASVLLVGSLLIYQLLFKPEGQLHEWFTAPFSASLSSDPDIPPKSMLINPPLGPKAVVPSSGLTDDFPNAASATDSSGPGSGTDESSGLASGSGDTSGSDSGDSSGSGSGAGDGSGSGGSSGPGSGGSGGDSSGQGSGGGSDGGSSGQGSGGGSVDDSSGHGSGSDAPAASG